MLVADALDADEDTIGGPMAEQGILVHGGNHFIVNGPRPSLEQARKLLWEWEMPMPGRARADTSPWSICTSAFRENLTWAVVVEGDTSHSPAVTKLLNELAARAVEIVT